MWKRIALYGVLLAVGTLALQWLDYKRLAREHSEAFYLFLIAAMFLAIGVFVGVRVFSRSSVQTSKTFNGNPQAVSSLGLTDRELTVLQALADGHSNKEIAVQLNISPNTIKTHVARIFEKLEAKRRTDAINRARELGILR
jgi:DNA-binding NarL/FixJ family response regulator